MVQIWILLIKGEVRDQCQDITCTEELECVVCLGTGGFDGILFTLRSYKNSLMSMPEGTYAKK